MKLWRKRKNEIEVTEMGRKKSLNRKLYNMEREMKKPNFVPEKEDWALHGCSNNEEWHCYLKSLFERDLYSDLVDGVYVGVLPDTKKKLQSL